MTRNMQDPWFPPGPPVRPDRLEVLAEAFLERCRGEGPANCVARCPLHVDARTVVQLTAERRFAEALQLVRERLPFPGILGHVCTGQCERHCRCVDSGDAVHIRAIVRFLAGSEQGAPRHLVGDEPQRTQRTQRIAVVGGGPGGLLAAHDLARLGYRVTLLERQQRLGGCLVSRIPASRLPRPVVQRDLSVLAALAVEVVTGVDVGVKPSITSLLKSHAAVLLFPGFAGGLRLLQAAPELDRTPRDTVRADPLTCETGVEGLFAGGDGVSGPATVIDALAMGRRAAESAHRWLDGRDLCAGRHDGLPRPLLWNLETGEAERRRRSRPTTLLQAAPEPLTEHEAVRQARRCLNCVCQRCVAECTFLETFCRSPRRLAEQALDDPAAALHMVYSCNLCGLCAAVCPMGLDVGEMLFEARRQLVRQGLGPPPEHNRTMRDVDLGTGRGVGRFLTLATAAPGRRRSRRLFFPGCSLPGFDPRRTVALYELLRHHFSDTGVLLFCCGAPAEQIGMQERADQAHREIMETVASVGCEELLVACPDCGRTLGSALPELRVGSVWEVLAEHAEPAADGVLQVAIHDPCAGRSEQGLSRAVRTLTAAAGAVAQQREMSEGLPRCCGLGGAVARVNPALARQVARRRAGEAEQGLPIVTSCAGCRMALARAGAPALHLLELLFDPVAGAAAGRPPGRLRRYLNRFRARQGLARVLSPGRRHGA